MTRWTTTILESDGGWNASTWPAETWESGSATATITAPGCSVGAIDPLSTMSRRHQLHAMPSTASTAMRAKTSSVPSAMRLARDRRYRPAVAGQDVGFGVARMARGIAHPTDAAPFVTREVTLGAVASRARRTACKTSPAAPAARDATFGAAAWMAPRIRCQRNVAAVAIHAATFGAARR